MASATRRRLIAAVVFCGCAVLLGLAAWLEPAVAGQGTHEQLGLPPCSWVVLGDIPCPTCGMTTSFAHAANGDLLQAFLTQPLGAVVAIATAAALMVALLVLITGGPFALVYARLWSAKMTWGVIGLIALSWGYKILRFKGLL